ncbi:erythromycin esterase family protein [Neptunitalea lumnitzerae]|uniref:Erythromycin esterase n=1 Tax=Neptunitalea lumnitzerae TaxID=2965509 RepID=A0ABQ5MGC5_9FLAO|nr:erythromycin esterase family protein [Neptunitalea sp. Y10]GLB48466.1 hypothetical protein Y10_08340 [Neptunitalea sp. Y10]
MYNKLVLLLAFFISTLVFSQDTNFIPLLTINPAETNFSDLKKLDVYLKDKTIIGVGEATHGTSEFTTMRHRFFKYLVTTHGFNTFILEADYGGCMRINNYIHGADDVVTQALNEVRLYPWLTQEMVALINWMKAYNEEHPEHQLNFVGADMQMADVNIKQLYRLIPDGGLKAELQPYTEGFRIVYEKQAEIVPIVKEIQKAYTGNEIQILAKATLQNLEVDFRNGKARKMVVYRDECMANNILFYKQLYPETKAMFFAHNTHVSYENDGSKGSAGYHLKKALGDAYYTVGMEFHTGTFQAVKITGKDKGQIGVCTIPDSKHNYLGKYLAAYGDLLFVLQNQLPDEINKMHAIGASVNERLDNIRGETKWFDAFIFVKNSTATSYHTPKSK